jgi:hypothetical protein
MTEDEKIVRHEYSQKISAIVEPVLKGSDLFGIFVLGSGLKS